MLRALHRIRRLPDGLRACSLSTNASLAVTPADPNTATASQSSTQLLDNAGPPGRSATSQTKGQTAEDGQSAAPYVRNRPSAGVAQGRAPWRRTVTAQAGGAGQHSATPSNSGDDFAAASPAKVVHPRDRRERSWEPRPAGRKRHGADGGNDAGPADEGARRRRPTTHPHGANGGDGWRPEHARSRRWDAPPKHPASATGQPVSPAAQDSQARLGADAEDSAGTPAQRYPPDGSRSDAATGAGPQRAVQAVAEAEKGRRRTELRNLAERLKGLARGKGNSPARVAVAKTLHERYQALGGHRVGWFYTNRIRMHGQMRDFESCNQLYEEARSRKVDVDAWFYRAMLIACGQAQQEPYLLPPKYASRAREVMRDLQQSSIFVADLQTKIMWFKLLDVQAKAGLVDEAFAVFEEMQRPPQSVQPNLEGLNTLLNACARALPPWPAKAWEVLDKLMPAAGVKPDEVSFNTLLVLYGNAQDMDGAYRVWQEMQKRKVTPSEITERTIASAFAASPTLASELAFEARQWRQSAERAGQKLPKLAARPGSHAPHEQQRDVETAEQGSSTLWVLDLHQMSAASARVSLLRRLDQLAELVASEEHPFTPRPDGLEIITGYGQHSRSVGGGVLKDVVQEVLSRQGLSTLPVESRSGNINPGAVRVPQQAFMDWAKRQARGKRGSAFMHTMSLRYSLVFGAASTAAVAAYVVPKIMEHA